MPVLEIPNKYPIFYCNLGKLFYIGKNEIVQLKGTFSDRSFHSFADFSQSFVDLC